MFQYFTKGSGPEADEVTRKKTFVHILLGEAEEPQVKVGAAVLAGADRVCFGDEMAFVAVAEDHTVGAQFLFPVDAVGGGEGLCARGGRGGPVGRGSGVSDSRPVTVGSDIDGPQFSLGDGKIESLKKTSEVRVDSIGVLHKILVETLNISWM